MFEGEGKVNLKLACVNQILFRTKPGKGELGPR